VLRDEASHRLHKAGPVLADHRHHQWNLHGLLLNRKPAGWQETLFPFSPAAFPGYSGREPDALAGVDRDARVRRREFISSVQFSGKSLLVFANGRQIAVTDQLAHVRASLLLAPKR
jgi:hypothetical protein